MGKNKHKNTSLAVSATPEERSVDPYLSISDPALAEYLGLNNRNVSGVEVSDASALGVTAFWRGVHIIAGTIAGLPFKTYEEVGGERVEVDSWLDNPANPYPVTPFNWVELAVSHMVVRGECFLRHTYNAGGALIGAWPIHPGAVAVKWTGASKQYTVSMVDGTQEIHTPETMTQVMGLSLDGLRGLSVISVMRNAIGLGIAGEQAAGRSFANGMLLAGVVTPDEDMEEEEAKVIKAGLSAKMTGIEHAGDIAVVNRHLTFTAFSMTNQDAQFLQSREFSVIDFGRILGIPAHLLGATEKQTSWGTGIAEQNRGLARFTLMGWTSRLEQAISMFMLGDGLHAEFDYAGLLQGSPKEEIDLLIEQVKGGILTVDEARAIRNLPPMTPAQKAESKPPAPPVAPPTPIKQVA